MGWGFGIQTDEVKFRYFGFIVLAKFFCANCFLCNVLFLQRFSCAKNFLYKLLLVQNKLGLAELCQAPLRLSYLPVN